MMHDHSFRVRLWAMLKSPQLLVFYIIVRYYLISFPNYISTGDDHGERAGLLPDHLFHSFTNQLGRHAGQRGRHCRSTVIR